MYDIIRDIVQSWSLKRWTFPQKLQALEDDFKAEVVRRKYDLDEDTLREMLAELRRQQCDVIALQVREFEAMKRKFEERLAATEARKNSHFVDKYRSGYL